MWAQHVANGHWEGVGYFLFWYPARKFDHMQRSVCVQGGMTYGSRVVRIDIRSGKTEYYQQFGLKQLLLNRFGNIFGLQIQKLPLYITVDKFGRFRETSS